MGAIQLVDFHKNLSAEKKDELETIIPLHSSNSPIKNAAAYLDKLTTYQTNRSKLCVFPSDNYSIRKCL